MQCESHVWLTGLPSWCLHGCIHLAPMTVTCHPDAVRLTGNVRGPDRWQCLRSSEPMQDDLSPDDRPQPVIYLVTALMWVKWAGAGWGGGEGESDKRQREREWLQERKTWQTLFNIKISTTAISYISMGMPAQEPIISSVLGKKSDLQNRSFSHLVCGNGVDKPYCYWIILSALNFLYI